MESAGGSSREEGKGENKLLLDHDEDSPRRPSNDNLTLDVDESKTIDWRAPAIILGFVCFESFGFYGMCTNLVIYLSSILHESNVSVARSITNWAGASYFTPFLGALIADSYLGSYGTIFYSSLIQFLGTVIITLSASLPSLKPPPCKNDFCPSATGAQNFVFYSGLYLIAFGSGGVKSSLLPLGADQFDVDNQVGREKRASFFNWFYFCNNVGALISSTLIVWVQENISWSIGYSISTLCMATAMLGLIYGTPMLRLQEPRGSPLSLQVVMDSLGNFISKSPRGSSFVHEMDDTDFNDEGTRSAAQINEYSTLSLGTMESASQIPGKECVINKAEEMKMLLRLFPIWLTSIVYSVAYAQTGTTFVEQGKAMYTMIGSFSIPPASLAAFETVSVMLCAALYDTVIAATVNRLPQLQRMGTGHFFMILAMAITAIVESIRLTAASSGKPISILWQLPQYFVVAVSEVFFYIGQLEFFYDQGPDSMRSLSTSLSLLTVSLGSYLSSLVVTLVSLATARGESGGWISRNLDEGHLDYFFWLVAALCLLNFICYIACAGRYRLKKMILDC